MYVYPYGDSQQLNLDWIINKLKELEDQETSAADLEEIANVFIALTHSSGTQYRRYDYCYYQGKLYRALNDNIGPFNASDWMEVRLGDDIPIITRLINAIDASAVFDVKFDTSGTNGKLQQKYNNAYHDVVEVDYTPVQNSKRPLSSNAGYDLKGAITALAEKTITYERKDLATSDISTPVDQGVYVWYITSATPDNFGTGGVILTISFATWLIAQLGYGNNGNMYFRQYNTGTWSTWKTVNTDTAPIIPPPSLINADIVKVDTPLLNGTLKSYTPVQSGWYQVRAYNAAAETELEVAFCDSSQSYIYSDNYRPPNTGTYAKCVSSWLYYKAGETIYYYLIGQNESFCGLYYSPVQQ